MPVATPVKTKIELEDIVNKFGTIDNPLDSYATYILPDGRIMDTKSDEYDLAQHENVARYISDTYGVDDLNKDMGSLFMDSVNAVRVTPWIPAFYLPRKRLTIQQENVIIKMLEELKTKLPMKRDGSLMISNLKGDQYLSISKIDDPEEILDSIFGYYTFGLLLEKKLNVSSIDVFKLLDDID